MPSFRAQETGCRRRNVGRGEAVEGQADSSPFYKEESFGPARALATTLADSCTWRSRRKLLTGH